MHGKKICQINRVKNSFDRNTLCTIISALVLSKLFYCSTVWSNTTAANIKKLQANHHQNQEIWAYNTCVRQDQMATSKRASSLQRHHNDILGSSRAWLPHTCVSLSRSTSLFTIITLETVTPWYSSKKDKVWPTTFSLQSSQYLEQFRQRL